MSVDKSDLCACCGGLIEDGFYSWSGPPFSVRQILHLCMYCGSVVKPKSVDIRGTSLNIVGTSSNDVYSVREMIEDGFGDLKRIAVSLKAVGKLMGLPRKIITEKINDNKPERKQKVKK